ncbi:hypothetical protein FDUTEX481_00280 [Tolypothrix sp. PCC 7601]|nr:hypothetical protein FDUTEX481_00280 [Tolypothrix sp. PCC 7601]
MIGTNELPKSLVNQSFTIQNLSWKVCSTGGTPARNFPQNPKSKMV